MLILQFADFIISSDETLEMLIFDKIRLTYLIISHIFGKYLEEMKNHARLPW